MKEQEQTPEQTVDETRESPRPADAASVPPANETARITEALLFASADILTVARLKSILPGNPDARVIKRAIGEINQRLQKEHHPFEIVEIGGGYMFRTVPYYHPWVRQLFREKSSKKLSIQALESLAIVAYKQPITKAEIESVRGVLADGALKTLLEKHLVTVAGRSDKPGHPLLYGTTPAFLQYFGINRLSDLPKMDEFEAMVQQKLVDLTDEEIESIEALTAAGDLVSGEAGGEDAPQESPSDTAGEEAEEEGGQDGGTDTQPS